MKKKPIKAASSAQFPMGSPAARSVRELLSHSDEDFITCAYLTLLHRPPDLSGMNYYMSRLRKGYSRANVITQMLKSDEAKRSTVDLPGLKALQRRQLRAERGLGKAAAWVARQLRHLVRGARLPRVRMIPAKPRKQVVSDDLHLPHSGQELPDLSGLSLVAQKILIDLHEAAWDARNKRGS